MGGRLWSKKEENELKLIYHKNTNKELSKKFNRTVKAIQAKACKLNLNKAKWHKSQRVSKQMQNNNHAKGMEHSKETKNKISKIMKNKMNNPKYKRKKKEWWNSLTDKQKHEYTKDGIKAMAERWNQMTYKERLEDTKERIKKANKANQEIWDNLNKQERLQRMKEIGIFEGHKKWYNSLSDEEKMEYTLKRVKAVPKQQRTSIEIKTKEKLDELNIEYIEQKRVGVYQLDFFLPNYNLDLECDGDYWHSKPEVIERDKARDEFMKNKGYNVARMTGTEIRENVENKLNKILSHIKGR